MTLNDLLRDRRLRAHRTSPGEIGDLLRLAERDEADAAVEAISLDRRFAAAYHAALSRPRSQAPRRSGERYAGWGPLDEPSHSARFTKEEIRSGKPSVHQSIAAR